MVEKCVIIILEFIIGGWFSLKVLILFFHLRAEILISIHMDSHFIFHLLTKIIDISNNSFNNLIEVLVYFFFFSQNMCAIFDEILIEICKEQVKTLVFRKVFNVMKWFLLAKLNKLLIAVDAVFMGCNMTLTVEIAVSAEKNLLFTCRMQTNFFDWFLAVFTAEQCMGIDKLLGW